MTTAYATTHVGPDTPSISKTLPFPVDWDHYSLTSLMFALERQTVATFANARKQVQPVLDIDAALMEQTPTIFHQPQAHEVVGSMLFTRMFSVLRAAARLMFAGQQYEARAVLRSALECGMYGWSLTVDANLREIWRQRENSDAARQAARNALTWGRLKKALRVRSQPLSETVSSLYDDLIDLGAHPNPGGIVDGLFTDKDAEGKLLLMTMVGDCNPKSIISGLDELLRVTRAGFELLCLAMPERMKQTGIGPKVTAIFDAAGYR
jgi:hypothetical protein